MRHVKNIISFLATIYLGLLSFGCDHIHEIVDGASHFSIGADETTVTVPAGENRFWYLFQQINGITGIWGDGEGEDSF